jgi:hypothetical protein
MASVGMLVSLKFDVERNGSVGGSSHVFVVSKA